MNIVVLVKQVPDSGSARSLDPADNTVARATADNVINEMDEYAIEEALLVRDREGGEVTILTVGPDSATDAASGTRIIRSTTDGRNDGSIRGRPMPSIRDACPVAASSTPAS